MNPEFIKGITARVFRGIALDKAVDLRDHGVNVAFIEKERSKGIKAEYLDDYIKIRDNSFIE